MNKLIGIKPYSDSKLEWNEVTNCYELTFQFCKDEYESNFRDDDILKKRIKKNSRRIYNFIESRVNQYNKPIVMALINRTEQGRSFIFEMLRTQFEADVETGYNDLGDTPAVNIANGQILPREELQRNQVTVATEQVWDNNSSYFGINIGYQGRFPSYYFLMVKGL